MPPCTMPNSAWSVAVCAALARAAQAAVRSTASRITSGGLRQRWADVEHHLDVGTESLLDVDGDLRREAVRRPVVDALEGDTVVVDLRIEREDLEAARVGEGEPVPAGEPTEPTEPFDEIGPRPQHQVVGVAEHDLRADALVVGGAQVLDRAACAHRHEQRGGVAAACRRRRAGASGAVGGVDVELDGVHRRDGTGPWASQGGTAGCDGRV